MAAPPATLRALLSEAIDYAGLFPPASLSMLETVRRYATYRRAPEAWALGRLVVPASRLEELHEVLQSERVADPPWPLSILLGADVDADVAGSLDITPRSMGIRVDSFEGAAADADEVGRLADRVREVADHFAAPLYVELPLSIDIRGAILSLRRARVRAKARTGGVTASAIPPASQVLRFLEGCIGADFSFKVTAGLHHAVRGEHPLTYEPGGACGTMHGFLNVFAAAALLTAGVAAEDVAPVLDETEASAFRFHDELLEWHGRRAGIDAVRLARRRLDAFGSCSFEEPIAELRALGLV